MGLSRTNTMGRIIITAVMLFRQEEMRNIMAPNSIRQSRFFPWENWAIRMARSCMMPVPAIRLVNSSMAMRMTSTS